jgi:hypothetical protein
MGFAQAGVVVGEFLLLTKYRLQVKEENQDKHLLVQKVQLVVDDQVEWMIYLN